MLILVLAAASHPSLLFILLAQASGAAGDVAPWLTVVNLGVSGLMLYLFATDRIAPTQERNRLREEISQRNAQDRDTLIPLLTRVLDVLARATEAQAAERRGK